MLKEKNELMERCRTEYAKRWGSGSRMLECCMKQTDVVVPLENGGIVVLEKPRIETTFCFGYGFCGMTTEEEMDKAYEEESRIYNERIFKKKNLEGINQQIYMLNGIRKLNFTNDELKRYPYWDATSLKAFILVNSYDSEDSIFIPHFYHISDLERVEKNLEVYVPTEADVANILAGLEEQRERFSKRLDTYLKRYGTSKLRTWTYLRD